MKYIEMIFNSDLDDFRDAVNGKISEVEHDGGKVDDIKFSENENGYVAMIIASVEDEK